MIRLASNLALAVPVALMLSGAAHAQQAPAAAPPLPR